MGKRKKIIISLCISLIILIGLEITISNKNKNQYIEAFVLKEDIQKGEKILEKQIEKIYINRKSKGIDTLQIIKDEYGFMEHIAAKKINKGQILTSDLISSGDEILKTVKDMQYIAVPVSNSNYCTAFKIKKGDNISIYFTGKKKNVDTIIFDRQKVYSNNTSEGLVTCELLTNVEVVSVHNSTGAEVEDSTIADVVVRINKQDAIKISNLKSQGTFDIVLN